MAKVPEVMKCLIKEGASESYVLQETKVPEPVGDEVLIKVEKVALCGSDIPLYLWNEVAREIATLPFIPGHECTGVVIKCGPDAIVNMGQRVAIENHFFCGECYQCQHERGDICQNLNQYGHGRGTVHGGCSEYSIVSSKYCYCLKSQEITSDEAVLMEAMGVAHNAMEQLQVAGEDVLIIGCGPVGCLAIAIAKSMNAKRIICADVDNKRMEMAKTMGADFAINTEAHDLKLEIIGLTKGDGIGRLCEMSGATPIVNSCFGLLRKGGRMVMVGLPKGPLHVEHPLPDIVFKSLTLKSIHGRRIFHTWEECESLITGGLVDVTKIVSHTIPMSRFEEAFKLLLTGKATKIIMDPST